MGRGQGRRPHTAASALEQRSEEGVWAPKWETCLQVQLRHSPAKTPEGWFPPEKWEQHYHNLVLPPQSPESVP